MCTHKRYITNKYTGKDVLVKCGHCPACIVERADRYKRMIDAHDKAGYTAAFITLTYSNDFCPFVYESDINRYYNADLDSYDVPVYRDKHIRLVKGKNIHKKKYDVSKCLGVGSYMRGDIPVDYKHRRMRGQSEDKIAVLWYKDLQNFIKRLRINCFRDYGIKYPISYFAIGEYGPTTSRCHFHVLVWSKASDYENVKNSAVKAWPFASDSRTRENISQAVDCSRYLSSYCNCTPYVKGLLSTSDFRPKTFHSVHFGENCDTYEFTNVYEKVRRGCFEFPVQRFTESGCPVSASAPFPAYVISRYFPKIKGFSRLTPNEIERVYGNPENLFATNLRRKLEYSLDDCFTNISRIKNTYWRYYLPNGIGWFDFSDLMSKVYASYGSFLIKHNFKNADTVEDIYQCYDNIAMFLHGKVMSPNLKKYFHDNPLSYSISEDYNEFNNVITDAMAKTERHHDSVKKAKITNSGYSHFHKDF